MSGALLLLPFLCIRFGLLSILNADAVTRAAHFAPMYGKEQIAYWVYQLSTAAIFVGLFFLRVPLTLSWPVIFGWVVYLFGLVLCSISTESTASPAIPCNGFADPVHVLVFSRYSLSNFCALDYSGGRAMVQSNIWRPV